jgi:signal transduction histidine kinase
MIYTGRLRAVWERRSLHRLAWASSLVGFALLFVWDGWHRYEDMVKAVSKRHDLALLRVATAVASVQASGGVVTAFRASQIYMDEVGLPLVHEMSHQVTTSDGHYISGNVELEIPEEMSRKIAKGSREPYLFDGWYRNEPVRMASVSTVTGQGEAAFPARLLLVEPHQNRQEAKGEGLQSIVVRGILSWMVSTLFVGCLLWLSLQPIYALCSELARRGDKNYLPLDEERPAELTPLVRSLNQLLEAQRTSVEQQRRFLADASHQLRTPLAVLRTQMQGMASGELNVQETLPKMIRTVDRSTSLATQLLSMVKVEQLSHEARWAPVSLNAVASDVAIEFAPLIARKRLEFSLDAIPVTLRSDAWMLGEIIRNLMSNAIHHSPVGSSIGIVIRRLRHEVELIVWDAGGGVSESVQERLFEPFMASKGGTGIGLGLAICRQIADAMTAQVYLFNRQERGTVVGCDAVIRWPSSLLVPAADAQPQAVRRAAVGAAQMSEGAGL